jgi:hypothetical protein
VIWGVIWTDVPASSVPPKLIVARLVEVLEVA